ncbi:hypothetical protein NUH88_20795 [Nisaea acidiphila]|uniref:Cytochrome c domain-containing protein n=1 Tax=Nisaea acidiphila TaxID=1862145 RepID=A0A9J7AQE2_9PROT|nr:hypothetical protein [Nisaea acidiphila]UUX49819.1 hypothetical protein NUH88_20795 [Nisaea acidiphila]
MRTYIRNSALYALLTAPMIFGSGQTNAQNTQAGFDYPHPVKKICTVGETEFKNSWASITFPKATGWARAFEFAKIVGGHKFGPVYDKTSGMVYVFPADGPGFTDADANSDCDFFNWSTQMFYWLTSPVTAVGSFPTDPVPPTSTTDYVFASEFFYTLDEGSLKTQKGPLHTIGARTEKSNGTVDSIEQAGGSGVLFYNPPKSLPTNDNPLVYYSIHTNRPYGYQRAADLAPDLLGAGNVPKNFVQSEKEICDTIGFAFLNGYAEILDPIATGLYALFCLGDDNHVTSDTEALKDRFLKSVSDVASPPNSAVSVEQVETAVDYLAMSMELKMSWVEAASLENPEAYIRQEAIIPTFTARNDGGWALVQSGTKTATLALVGMHVVGSVKGHPEMIWATFEHANNTPNTNYVYLDEDDDVRLTTDIGFGSWLFSDSTPTAANMEYAIGESEQGGLKIVSAPGVRSADLTKASNVNRLSPWGTHIENAYDQKEIASAAESNSEVISANLAAIGALNGYYKNNAQAPSDPRVNYILTGASWGHTQEPGKLNTKIFPDGTNPNTIVGTAAMANTTMETFTQTFNGRISENGCFSCHGTYGSSNAFVVSHIFDSINSVEK